MLEPLKLEVAWHNVEAGEVGGSDDIAELPLLIVVSDRTVNRVVVFEIELRLQPEQRRKRSLRVQVNGQRPIAAHCKILGKMRRGRRLSRTALEIGDRDDLKMLSIAPLGKVGGLRAG